jgi:transmembrane sensor
MTRETASQIDGASADWAARIDKGPLSPEDDARLEDWLAGDPRRLGAFMRMRAVALHSERAQALGPSYNPETFVAAEPAAPAAATPLFSRRRLLWMGGGAAVAASAVGALGLSLLMRGASHATGLGEVRVVTLEDGSVITLNTNSQILVRYDDERRLVLLEEGEALFDVAHDTARPFIVEAGGTFVRAVGTSFTVKRLGSAPVEILVREGVVEVTRPSAAAPVRMAANTRVVATDAAPALRPASLAPDEVTRELAWRDGRIAFQGETLARAAETFARYSDTRIIIDDPAVGREEITGLFAANDPVSFARAAALSLDLEARVGPGEVRLSR